MFVPLHDDLPLRMIRLQYVTFTIIVGNVIIFLFTGAFGGEHLTVSVAEGFGVIPADFFRASSLTHSILPEPLTLVSYIFLHASWLHMIFNMLFLWVFADNVEDAFGHVGFILFYLLCGIAAGLTHTIMNVTSEAPLIGASGAVSGVIGAYVLLFPRARVVFVTNILLIPIPMRVSAFWVLGGWFLLQVAGVFFPNAHGSVEIALWAHIGGFLTGLILTMALRSRLLVKDDR
jgi:membrane associated rhomboid family serine protease